MVFIPTQNIWTRGNERCVVIELGEDDLFVHGRGQRIITQPTGQKVDNMIAAFPRSGTRYISRFLKQFEIDMPHEVPGPNGVVSWQHISPGKYYVECDNVIHMTRHPIQVISSAYYVLHASAWPFMGRSIPGIDANIDWIKIMRAWIEWNNIIEKRAVWRFKIEDLYKVYPELVERLGGKNSVEPNFIKRVNARVHPLASYQFLEKQSKEVFLEFRNKAEQYDYTIEPSSYRRDRPQSLWGHE